MKLIVLDGYALNPGDLSYECLNQFGDVTIYDRTDSEAEAIASDPDAEGYTDINKMMEDILSVAEQEPEYKV